MQILTTERIDRLLEYRTHEQGVCLGAFVRVPLGNRRAIGVVWDAGKGEYDASKLKTIETVLDIPPLRDEMRHFIRQASDYTLTPLNALLRLATRVPSLGDDAPSRLFYQGTTKQPARITKARERVLSVLKEQTHPLAPTDLAHMAQVSPSVLMGLVQQGVLTQVEAPRDVPFAALLADKLGKPLSPDQETAANALRERVAENAYSTTLLRGITGSGKTEVYLEAVAQALRQSRQTLVLIPEIALTVDFMDRIATRFGGEAAQWHSGITQSQRRRTWHMVARNRAQVVVGARSALFLPFANLGLIVVDEEHDSSYKQEDGVIYSARDMAVLRARCGTAAVVLASATPALETWVNAQSGKYHKLTLQRRFGAAQLPDIRTIDLREQERQHNQWISPELAHYVDMRLKAGEQSLLFLNRRGYAPITVCRACSAQIGCRYCDSRMVEHRFRAKLICHQCGYSRTMPRHCPSCCAEGNLVPIGPGVERLIEEAKKRFEGAKIALLSSDMTLSPAKLKRYIQDIAKGGSDIIIGTQLVAKGHNFPLLTLVGVIDADLGLHGGDLRAAERTFQLMRQVAGRAGRADRAGVAYLQTHQPEHEIIKAIIKGDEDDFWQSQADERSTAGAPPFGRLVGVILSGRDLSSVMAQGRQLLSCAAPIRASGAQIYGPAPAPIAKLRGRYRVRFLIKAPRNIRIQEAIKLWLSQVDLPRSIRLAVDIDPQSFY